jgi:energy-coupling factor transporter transmembrane protein EcfT
MCAQCMTSAVMAGAAATGVRAYVAARHRTWATPKRLRWATVALVLAALAFSATVVVGPGAGTGQELRAPAPAPR